MEVYEAIAARKSVRAFKSKEVPDEVLWRLLEAGRAAPSASNRQEWRFVMVRDKTTREKLIDAACGQKFVGEAPVVLVCCAQTDEQVMPCGHRSDLIDVAIAIDHITLAAVSEGLGTCWIGAFNEEKVKEILGIPEGVRIVELLPIGYPVDPSVVSKSRLPLSDIVKEERW
jgi:nitroreductase